MAVRGGREPGKFPAGAVCALSRACANAAQTRSLRIRPYLLATHMFDSAPFRISGIRPGQADRRDATGAVHIADPLIAREGRADQHRACFCAQILRLVGPAINKATQVQPGGYLILIEVQGGITLGWIPAPSALLRIGWIQRVHPAGFADAPPAPGVFQLLGQQTSALLVVGFAESEHCATGFQYFGKALLHKQVDQ